MTGRPTTQGASRTELTDSPVRSGDQFDGLADASNRAPRLVTTTAENISVEPSGKAPLPPTKRSRPSPAPKRTKATKANGKHEAPSAPLTVSAAPTVPAAVPATPERASGAFTLAAALALATVAAYFSVTGMAEIFPGAPVAVMVLAATMEAGKLVIAGWLAAHWRRVGRKMRSVMVTLVAGLALINAAGVFGKLVEAHVSVAASARSSVTERIETLDARVTAQSATVADLDSRVAQIDRAVDESTRRGRVTRAINIATQQRVTRDGLDTQRQAATATLVGLQTQRAALVGERFRIEASAGPIQYLAMMAGAAPEAAVRWLILLMVLCCDPAAIALTVAATSSRR
jgi:cell division protein FtsB